MRRREEGGGQGEVDLFVPSLASGARYSLVEYEPD